MDINVYFFPPIFFFRGGAGPPGPGAKTWGPDGRGAKPTGPTPWLFLGRAPKKVWAPRPSAFLGPLYSSPNGHTIVLYCFLNPLGGPPFWVWAFFRPFGPKFALPCFNCSR